MGGSISLAGYICDINNYTVAFSDILMLLLAVSFWFLFRSSALQLQEDYKISQENSTIEKHTEIRIQNNVTKEIENAQILRNQMNTNYDIDIMTCSKEDMLTLAGFNKDKAAKFINLRACGKIWYDEDEFYKDFELKPHEIIYAQKRLKFPPKPNLKNGRTVDI